MPAADSSTGRVSGAPDSNTAARCAVGRACGCASVIASSARASGPGTSLGTIGGLTNRARAASWPVPGYTCRPVSASSSTNPSAYTSAGGPTG